MPLSFRTIRRPSTQYLLGQIVLILKTGLMCMVHNPPDDLVPISLSADNVKIRLPGTRGKLISTPRALGPLPHQHKAVSQYDDAQTLWRIPRAHTMYLPRLTPRLDVLRIMF
jgi:hypothetical protein